MRLKRLSGTYPPKKLRAHSQVICERLRPIPLLAPNHFVQISKMAVNHANIATFEGGLPATTMLQG
jgi:hypothetical protein